MSKESHEQWAWEAGELPQEKKGYDWEHEVKELERLLGKLGEFEGYIKDSGIDEAVELYTSFDFDLGKVKQALETFQGHVIDKLQDARGNINDE